MLMRVPETPELCLPADDGTDVLKQADRRRSISLRLPLKGSRERRQDLCGGRLLRAPLSKHCD